MVAIIILLPHDLMNSCDPMTCARGDASAVSLPHDSFSSHGRQRQLPGHRSGYPMAIYST